MDRGLPVTAPAAPSGAAVAAGARCGWRTGCGGLAVAFVAVAAAAGAQTFAASDPAMVKTLLEEFGYPTEIEYDPGGDRKSVV